VHHNPALARAIARDRVSDLRQSAWTPGHLRARKRRLDGIETVRLGAGWLLIEMGLRLAVPRGGINRPASGGQR
jgi:hypothetical protein